MDCQIGTDIYDIRDQWDGRVAQGAAAGLVGGIRFWQIAIEWRETRGMTMSTIDIKILELDAALDLAPLISAHAQEQKRGAPRQPDMFYAETLLTDRTAEVIGAYMDGKLVSFATFFDLPKPSRVNALVTLTFSLSIMMPATWA